MTTNRTPPKKKARELAKYFRAERVDYPYLKSVFRSTRSMSSAARFALRRARDTRTGKFPFRFRSVSCSPCICRACERREPFISSSRPVSTSTPIEGSGKCWRVMHKRLGLPVPCLLTSGGISCSPGSMRSIPNFRWPTRSKSTIRSWGASPFSKGRATHELGCLPHQLLCGW